ncbi:phosphotyrosyl phosphatase activator [Schizosaccharomyces japonicus yFS275]|uniref:Serine/threonine-protein phosphatase 2A activator n=1 Tax=Schizosaccharomyces japonicus (strain yFS275 / FY16936) TaxID=402676 RepID=B6JUX9_SCHJY|nr:phosphotyrosyl phosphatase activator [Schizosaccharomyces japonicus yFS275]EEB05083.1 phosphotyrosyl phosphatase activator [Schizosaccharomyces japonicus yFS275]
MSDEEQDHCFVPVRRIVNENDLKLFHEGRTYKLIDDFISELNESVQGCSNSKPVQETESIQHILRILDRIAEIEKENPPIDNSGSRFGNPAFRSFYDAVVKEATDFHKAFGLRENAASEAARYLIESWGNRTRIDYGSGHELNFICWLLCLRRLGVWDKESNEAIVLRVFVKYMKLMRLLQVNYWQEPAGSHGVWGLDDYHFLPFLFGSNQLSTHKYMRPRHIRDPDVLEMYGDDYLYLGCIRFINATKPGASLRWHSPMLDDISAVKTWKKVNEGMIKMYRAEVLAKLPIMQHFMFGYLLPAEPGMTPAPQDGSDADEMHVHSTYGDCCGIKVPSAIAAAASQGRRLPFD